MKVTALAGGVGAARLLSGFSRLIPAQDLRIIVNTGDDFRWMGLYICPDLDTIIYTLAGLANPETGWGVREDTFHALARLGDLGGETWFRVGDRDLATHLVRTHHMQSGESLSDVTRFLCHRSGVGATVLPMTESPVPTVVHTDEGALEFQDYFVRRRCSPVIRGLSYPGVEDAVPSAGVLEAIREADAVVVCPSNPYISIGPILAVPGIRAALQVTRARVLAVSPIIRGAALKGPAALMMRQLGSEPSAAAVAELYRDFLDLFVLDHRDKDLIEAVAALGLEARTTETVMTDLAARVSLANSLLEMMA